MIRNTMRRSCQGGSGPLWHRRQHRQPLPDGIASARRHNYIRSGAQKVSIQDSRIAIAVSLALAAAAQAQAQQTTEEPKTMSKISVEATEPEETPKVDRVQSEKFTQPLLDTPQTIAVVSKE